MARARSRAAARWAGEVPGEAPQLVVVLVGGHIRRSGWIFLQDADGWRLRWAIGYGRAVARVVEDLLGNC